MQSIWLDKSSSKFAKAENKSISLIKWTVIVSKFLFILSNTDLTNGNWILELKKLFSPSSISKHL